ncbi:DUF6412 domain-containing protein [Mycetocola zhujimingii]|uniref:Uncharacterized protein n=1 Tax=Mycetocola zhujimingii TaxID=2079792 RepID=A0A2U1TAB7_9MICO|nr:DUF6412 domain-containing protein [Mycetocola zhujimingii]AWB85458.1 hypothetical protein C3E77_01620 [Mycetocola zhujimingii]PWC04632.1 hypothetical protein DF223_14395 [Mycetocola zhujimingii]
MRSRYEQLIMVLTMSFLVLAVAQAAEPSAVLVAGVAVLAASALLGARYLAVIIIALRLMVGSRAREHRESLTRIPAPSHPNTAGRPQPRAPGLSEAVA